METLLRTENLTKKFKNQVAIQNISMNVPENSVYGLLGPNGAGKSTTLKMIAGILKPTRGSIIFNKHPWKRSDLSNIGALIETPPLYGNLSHEQNSTHSVFMRVCEAWQPLLSLQIYSNNQLQMV